MLDYKPPQLGDKLTPSEQKTYALVASALTNKEIARVVNVTEGTVKHHVSVVLKKLGLKNRIQLALRFHGITIPNSALTSEDETFPAHKLT